MKCVADYWWWARFCTRWLNLTGEYIHHVFWS